MAVIGFLLGLPGRIKAWAVGLALALVALMGTARWLRRDAVRDDRRETALEAAERNARAMEAARKAEAKAKADMRDGATPDEVLRRNDGGWNR